jgi:hypothetical protein
MKYCAFEGLSASMKTRSKGGEGSKVASESIARPTTILTFKERLALAIFSAATYIHKFVSMWSEGDLVYEKSGV